MRQLTTKVLVVYDVQVKAPEVSHVPLIINYGVLVHPFNAFVRLNHLPLRSSKGSGGVRSSVREKHRSVGVFAESPITALPPPLRQITPELASS